MNGVSKIKKDYSAQANTSVPSHQGTFATLRLPSKAIGCKRVFLSVHNHPTMKGSTSIKENNHIK